MAKEKEGIVAPPFGGDGERDDGDTASSSLSEGRLTTDLRETAAVVSVLTRDLPGDIGALSAREMRKSAPDLSRPRTVIKMKVTSR